MRERTGDPDRPPGDDSPAAHVKHLPVIVLVALTALVWGGGGLASKALLAKGLDPFTVTGAPFLIGAALAWVVTIKRRHLTRSAARDGALLGVVNLAIPALFFNFGYETLPAGIVTLLLSVGPVVTAITAHFVFQDERFSRAKALGLLLSIAGVTVLVGSPGAVDSPSGVAWVVTGAVIAGASGVMSRVFALRHGARALVASQLTAGGITPITLAFALGRPLVAPGEITFVGWSGLAVIGAVASYGGFRMIMRANEIGTTGEVSIVGYLIPIVGVAGGILFFDEGLSPNLLVGAALILGGVAAVGRASGKPVRLVRAAG